MWEMTHLKPLGRVKQCPGATQSQTVLEHKCMLYKATSESVRRPLLRTWELERSALHYSHITQQKATAGEKRIPQNYQTENLK